MELSVVIPVYNAQASLEELSDRLLQSLTKLNLKFEVIFVNDKSTDSSWKTLTIIAKKSSHIKIINLSKNRGQQLSVVCGLEHASGSVVVTMDDDLQHRPEDIGELYHDLINDEESDAVIASFKKKKHSFFRNLATKIVKNYISKSVGIPKGLDLTSFRAIRKHVVKKMCQMKNQTPVVGFLLFEVTTRVKNLTVKHESRDGNQSSYTMFKLIKYFFVMVNEHIYLPLTLLYWGGLIITCVSFFATTFYTIKFFLGTQLPGFTSIILLLLFTVGVLSLGLGIIGKYMIKLIRGVENTPLYTVKDKNF